MKIIAIIFYSHLQVLVIINILQKIRVHVHLVTYMYQLRLTTIHVLPTLDTQACAHVILMMDTRIHVLYILVVMHMIGHAGVSHV